MAEETPATKHKRGKALSSGEKEMVRNVFEALKEGNPLITIKDIANSTAGYLGISPTTVFKIIKQVRTEGRCRSPKRTKVRCKKYENVDDAMRDAIRKKVGRLGLKKPPTIDAILKLVNEDDELPTFARTTFYRILQDMDLVCCRNTGIVAQKSPSIEEPSSSGLQSFPAEQAFVDCDEVHVCTSSREMQPAVFRGANVQSCTSAAAHGKGPRSIPSDELNSTTPLELEVQEEIQIKQERGESMDEDMVSDDPAVEEKNLPPIEHISVGEADVKLEFEDTLSSEVRAKTPVMQFPAVHSEDPVAHSESPAAIPAVVYYNNLSAFPIGACSRGGAAILPEIRPEGGATIASQLHRKTWIICSPAISSQAHTDGSQLTACSPQPRAKAANGGGPTDNTEECDWERARATAGSHALDDEFDSFGKVVAAKLRHMTANQRLIAEKLVHDVLFHGQLGVLLPGTALAPLLGS